MRPRALLALLACLSIPAVASAHTSVGGGSGPDDPNADCLRWETVTLPAKDAAADDGGAADAGRTDAGASAVTVLRCVEHATMFGCACALGSPARAPDRTATTWAAAALAALVAAARRPRHDRRDRRSNGR
jgi:MYXO-CTERM domain-containing protein